LNIEFDKPYLLGIQVGTEPELSPRMELTSTAYSLNADKVDGKEASEFVEKVDGVSPVNGNIDLVAGTNVTITPDNTNHKITISASGGTGGDNLGNHKATQNIKLNGNWLSGDGENEGVFIDNAGKVGIGTKSQGALLEITGSPASLRGQLKIADPAGDDPFISFYAGTNFKSAIGYSNGAARWSTNDGSNLCITGGNVGIGTTDAAGVKLKVLQNGNEKAGLLQIDNVSNPNNALMVSTNGSGNALWVGSYGTGNAGYFGIGNPNNNNPALSAVGNRYGGSFKAQGNNGVGIYAEGGANGYAGYFQGKISCKVLEITGGSDIAEPFDMDEQAEIQPGLVVTIDPQNPGKLKIADKTYDRCVAGIISGAGDITPGMIMGQNGTVANGEYPVALSGRVYCWADAANNAIQPGDLLTTSNMPGHAMKVTDYMKAQGAIIGKAMSFLESGQGLVLVLVTLQ